MRSSAFHRVLGRPKSRPMVLFLLALGACAFVLPCGCVYDSDQRCTKGQIFDGTSCGCPEGLAATDAGCAPCDTNEVATSGRCVCVEGFGRSAADAPCTALPVALGKACDTASEPCTDATYNHCLVDLGTSGYCTSGCDTTVDCPASYACNTSASPSYCQKPPLGLNAPCTSDADCATFEAKFCIPNLNVCTVSECTVSPNSCFPGHNCCDLSKYNHSNLCLSMECP